MTGAGPLFQPPEGTPPDPEAEARALVALSMVPGVGPGRLRALLARFGGAAAVLAAPPAALAGVEGVGRQTAAAIRAFDAEAATADQFERAARVGAEAVTLADDRYPRLLRQIYDPPAVLWVRGDLRPEDERAVAIVGTRRASDYGRRVAHHFGFELARRGYTVVSGLAYGIDLAAHRGAVEAGGRTLAVLGSGVDRIYPPRHAPLAEQIADGQGAVVSEFPLGTPPDAPHFPRRNRVIAGLALGTLVAEARASGGALLTAWMATEQNRAVFAVPAPVFGGVGEGGNALIRKGYASLVTSVEELLEEIAPQVEAPSPETSPAPPAPPDLSSPERKLYDALSPTPIGLDALCERTGLDTSTALVYLLSLEFKGLVRQMAGKQFFRA
jgi:DNA processing protein